LTGVQRLAAQLHELVLLAAGLAIHDPVIDVGLAHPAPHRLDRDVEIGSDLGLAQVAVAGDSNDVTLEFGRDFFGTTDVLAVDLDPQKRLSTRPAAIPMDVTRGRLAPCCYAEFACQWILLT
jgi:hypothetical protein